MKTINTVLFILFFAVGITGLLFSPCSLRITQNVDTIGVTSGNLKMQEIIPTSGPLKIISSNEDTADIEKEFAGRAFSLALSRYNEMGFKFKELERIKVYFCAPADWKEDVPENTIAFYNDVDQYILMPPFNSKFFQERTILGTMGNKDIYFSILFHEFCHYLNKQANPRIVRHHDEFIACALQLSTLPEKLRNQIIDKFSEFVFKNRNDISLLAYINTPKQFQVASFLFCNSHHTQMKRIITKSHLVIRDPFLIPYEL